MKSRIKNIEECVKLFRIEVPRESVERVVEEVYREIRKTAKIPGFRQGNAPRDLLERHYSEEAKNEILKRLIPGGYEKALETHKVVPIGLPRIYNVSFEKGKALTFEAEVDERPDTKLKNYKGIRVTRKRIAVTQKEIDETLERLRNAYAAHETAERPVKKGDYAVCSDDAFAKRLNRENIGALKKEIESQLFLRKEAALKADMQNQILEKLLRATKFSVPSGLVRRQKELFAKRMEEALAERGVQKSDAEKRIKEMDSKLERDARDMARIYFILDEIARREKIEGNEKDKEARVLEFLLKEAEISEDKGIRENKGK